MPSCLVNQCISKTGKRGQNGQIILHPFPKDFSRIKIWLQQTGQIFSDLDALAQKILDENKRNKYRLCSCHFSLDSYIINIHGRTLRVDAIPTIFPIVGDGECIIEENLRKDRKRKRKRPFNIATNSFQQPMVQPPTTSAIVMIKVDEDMLQDATTEILQEPPVTSAYERIKVEEGTFEDSQLTEPGFCSIATQTDYTLSNSILLLKDQETRSDVRDGVFTPSFVNEKPKIMSRIQKGRDLCHTVDVQRITVKEEPEYYSDTDVSTRYWRVESSVSGKQELLLQAQMCNGVEQSCHSENST
ncbi:uncharacterized protein RB166_007747 [Leptodactylus fuscus]|uniref:uncharacterized protein LOC142204796 n=1 Tax=Leptodactylus fuscus TaxID=238119 RepID=UPI003F4E6059